MKRILIAVIVFVVLVAGGLLIAPSFIDWNKHKDRIITQLEAATGYRYEIAGGLEMAVLPFPHLSIEKLTISKPGAAEGAHIVRLDEASVQLALAPLFSGNVEVSKVQLVNPDFQLSIGKDGSKSWMTPELEARADKGQGGGGGGAAAELGNAVALNVLSVKNGTFTLADQRSGQTFSARDINLNLRGESLYGPYSAEGGLTYQGHKTRIKASSGRIDKLAESIAVQIELAFPDMASTLAYSGVVSYKNRLELQGETRVETPDLARLMKVALNEVPPYLLQKPLAVRGILTLTDKEAAYQNLRLSFAGFEGNGAIVARNFAGDAKDPLNLTVNLESSKPYVLDNILPPPAASKKTGQGDSNNKVAARTFVPETITLPKEISGSVNIKSAALSYKGVTYHDVAFSVESREKGFGGQVSLKAPGNTTVDVNSALTFAASSRSAPDGSVTLSDPVLVLDTSVSSIEPVKLAPLFVKGPVNQAMTNMLANNLTAEARLNVKPRQIDIEAAFVKLAETRVNASGAYRAGSGQGRDSLKLALNTYGLDADAWMKKMAGPASPVVPAPNTKLPKPAGVDVAQFGKTLVFPFDLDYSAEIQSLRLKGRDYSKLVSTGRFMGPQFTLDSLQLTSNAGDTLLMAGGVRDLATLGGIDLSLNTKIIDLEQTLQSFAVDTSRLPKGIGHSELLADFKGSPESLAFTANLKALKASMEAAGSIADAFMAPKVSDLTLRLQHPNYVDLARLYNPSFSSGVGIKKNFDVFASMNRNGNLYNFSQLEATIGPSNIKGDIVADLGGTKPVITAALQFTDLPIDELLGIQAGQKGAARAQPMRQTQDVRWSRNAIKTDMLHKANIALKATAHTISYGNWLFRNAGVNLDLKDGNLTIRQLDGGLYGGQVAVTGNLRTSAKEREPIAFDGKFLVQDASLEEFVRSFSGSQLVKAKGPISLDAEVSTAGLSPSALVSALKGKGTATGQNLVFEGFDLARLSRALAEPGSSMTENFTRLLDASLKGGTTNFDKLDSAYTIKEGVIIFDRLNLTGPTADVATTGLVSLPLWSLDIESIVKLKEPADAPPLRASFKGPLDKPAQTFGQNAMQQYFQKQIEGVLVNPLLEKLQEKGVLPGDFIGGTSKQAPQQAPAPQPQAEQPAQPQPQSQQQQQQQPQKRKEVRPEDVFMGILQNVIEGQ